MNLNQIEHLLSNDEGNFGSGAVFSDCRKYRWLLWRTWNAQRGAVGFIALNPSTADEKSNDPTIRRCMGFAQAWGYGGILMVNLFAYRATNPSDMMATTDPVGSENDRWIRGCHRDARITIAAWGAHGIFKNRDLDVCRIECEKSCLADELHCLGTTKDGMPRHPLYLKATTMPVKYLPRKGVAA